MKKAYLLLIAAVVVVGLAVVGFAHKAPVAGDSLPNPSTQLFNLSGTNVVTLNPSLWNIGNSVTNFVGNLFTANSIQVGGSTASNQINVVGIATSTVNQFTLGSITTATSTASSTVSIPVAGLSAGDPCIAGLTTAPTTAFGLDFNITTSSATSATGTVTYWNGLNATANIATGTLRVECHHEAI